MLGSKLPLIYLVLSCGHARVYNRLFEDLLGRYNKLVRPSEKANDTVRIAFRFKLSELVDVHEKEQVIKTSGWLIHHWFDERLEWNPSYYGNVTKLHVSGELIWLPDIILYNNANGSPHVSAVTKAMIRHDGLVTWTPPVVYNSMCKINVEWFPYDEQYCDMKFGSWTYSGTQLDLVHLHSDMVVEVEAADGSKEWQVQQGIDITDYQESVEFDLLSVVGTRHEKWYPCCDYPSIDITYYINIRRKKLFYTVNLVTPCVGLAALTSFVFYLPCESHQKIQLCISILVSLAVFFLVLMEVIPPTSLCIPLIGKYLVFTMLMVTASVILTVIVSNLYLRVGVHPVPDWTRRFFIEFLGRLLFVTRQQQSSRAVQESRKSKRMNALNAMNILEKQFNKTLFHIEMANRERIQLSAATRQLFFQLPFAERSKSVRTTKADSHRIHQKLSRLSSGSSDKASIAPNISKLPTATTTKLRTAQRNVHYIAQTLAEKRRLEENMADWQFISLVIDRILLVIFAAIISTGSTIALLSAPSLRDDRTPINSPRSFSPWISKN